MHARALRLAFVPLGVGFGLAVERAFYEPSLGFALAMADFAVGVLLIVAGALAWERRAESRVGLLLTLSGFAWFLGNLGGAAVYLHRGPLVHLVLSYPSGRLRGPLARAVAAAAYADALIAPLARSDALTLALAAAVALTSLRGFARSTGPARPAAAVALAASLALSAALGLGALDRLESWGHETAALWTYDVLVASIAVGLLVDLVRGRWAEAAVRGLVVDLGAASDRASLQAKLVRALGDRSLVLGYRLPETGAFVDDAGQPLALPLPGSGRTATALEEHGEQVGVLVHDEAFLADEQLIESVAAAAQLAVANARLQAEARTQADELELSRRRIVESTDRQRRRLEQELRDGPERLLERARAALDASVSAASGDNAQALTRLASDLGLAGQELREFAQGIRPTALADGGLMPALAALADQSPVAASVVGMVGRLPEPAEAALYFVCSEALANAVKHARAAHVWMHVDEEAGRARAVVVDDGVGGAELEAGSGLSGLADRVEALGGTLRLQSPRGAGTRVAAELPTHHAGLSGRASRGGARP